MSTLTVSPADAFLVADASRSVLGVEFSGSPGSMFVAIPWFVDGSVDDILLEWNSSAGTSYMMAFVQSSGGTLATLCSKSGEVAAGAHRTALASNPTSGSMPQYISEGAWYYFVFQSVSGDDAYSMDVVVTPP